MSVPRITSLSEPPVVGRYYLVPTVLHYWDNGARARPWPVLLPKHNDGRFFNFKEDHYHVDPRFLGARAWEHARRHGEIYDSDEPALASCQAMPLAPHRWGRGAGELPAVVWKRLLCRRADMPYQHSHREPVRGVQAHHAGLQCRRGRAGWICPHQNWPLGSVRPDADGVVTCPLHGLRINAATGVVLDVEAPPASRTAAPVGASPLTPPR